MKKYLTSDGRSGGVDGKYQTAKIDYKLLKDTQNAYLMNEAEQNGQKDKPGRLGYLARAACDAIGQTVFEDVLPYLPDTGPLNRLFNLYKTAIYKVFRARKHDHAQEALENNIPIAKEFFQNIWSVGNFGRGLVKIKSLYTVKPIGIDKENPIYLELTDDEAVTLLPLLKNLGKAALQNESAAKSIEAQYVRGRLKKGENEESTLAGVYSEITDRNLKEKGIVDPTTFQAILMPGDLWLTGMKGQRNVIYSSPLEGIEIVKYGKAKPKDHLFYRGEQDLKFTLTGLAYKFINIHDFSPIAAQSIVEDQMEHAIKSTHRRMGTTRADGIENPIVGMI